MYEPEDRVPRTGRRRHDEAVGVGDRDGEAVARAPDVGRGERRQARRGVEVDRVERGPDAQAERDATPVDDRRQSRGRRRRRPPRRTACPRGRRGTSLADAPGEDRRPLRDRDHERSGSATETRAGATAGRPSSAGPEARGREPEGVRPRARRRADGAAAGRSSGAATARCASSARPSVDGAADRGRGREVASRPRPRRTSERRTARPRRRTGRRRGRACRRAGAGRDAGRPARDAGRARHRGRSVGAGGRPRPAARRRGARSRGRGSAGTPR